jgi:hypothetical protein
MDVCITVDNDTRARRAARFASGGTFTKPSQSPPAAAAPTTT